MASYKYGENTVTGKDTLYTDNFIMYGSSRLGIKNAVHYNLKQFPVIKANIIADQSGFATLGDKQYEFSDHLGNVHMTISDRNKRHCEGDPATWQYNDPDILTSTDYYPGGYQMPERNWNTATSYHTPIIKEIVFDYQEDFSTATKTTSNTKTWVDNQWSNVPGNSTVQKGTTTLNVVNTACPAAGLVSRNFGVSSTYSYTLNINIASISGFIVGTSLCVYWYESNPGEAEDYKGLLGCTTATGNYQVSFAPTKSNVRFEIKLNNCTGFGSSRPGFSISGITMSRCLKVFPFSCLQVYNMQASTSVLTTASDESAANWKNEQPFSTLDVETYTGGKRIKVSSSNNTYGIYYDHFALVPGKEYTIQYKIDKGTSAGIILSGWEKTTSDPVYPLTTLFTQTVTASGTHSITFVPTKEQVKVQLRSTTAGVNFYLEEFSIFHRDSVSGGQVVNDTANYQFGFNGQLKDNEIYGEGNAYDYGDREYDPRSIRWWKVDKLDKNYPYLSPYSFAANNPIIITDKKGEYLIAGDQYSQATVLSYLKEQFGEDQKVFSFNNNGYLKVNKKEYKSYLKNLDQNSVKKDLIKGVNKVTESTKGVYVKVVAASNTSSSISIPLYEPTYKRTEGTSESVYDGYKTFYLDANIADADASFVKPLVGEYKYYNEKGVLTHDPVPFDQSLLAIIQKEDFSYNAEGGGKTQKCESCTFMHELLDHVLNEIIDSQDKERPQLNQVEYHNKALENLNYDKRDASDH